MVELSWRLFVAIQNRRLPLNRRVRAYRRLLQLDRGFWQINPGKGRESFKGFVLQMAMILLQNVEPLAPSTSITAEALTEGLLIAFFESADRITCHPRTWMLRSAARLLDRPAESDPPPSNPAPLGGRRGTASQKRANSIARHLFNALRDRNRQRLKKGKRPSA